MFVLLSHFSLSRIHLSLVFT